jgi:hypothetical protein
MINNTNAIYDKIVSHLNADAANRVVMQVQMAGAKSKCFAAVDLAVLRPDGNGVRFGKTYFFASQVRFAKLA